MDPAAAPESPKFTDSEAILYLFFPPTIFRDTAVLPVHQLSLSICLVCDSADTFVSQMIGDLNSVAR
jgi:hypothetical protein